MNWLPAVFSMMTEREFWDMFHKKHNPKYYNAKKKTQKKKTKIKKKGRRTNSAKRYTFSKSKS